jgi:hypothetical protein
MATMAKTDDLGSRGVEMTVETTNPDAPSESRVLAREMASSFGDLVRCYERFFSLTREEAIRRALEPPSEVNDRALTKPPDQVDGFELHEVARADPDRAIARWQEIKRAALENWFPRTKSGSNSGALVAQNEAQQADAVNRETQLCSGKADGEAVSASPCDN